MSSNKYGATIPNKPAAVTHKVIVAQTDQQRKDAAAKERQAKVGGEQKQHK